MSTREALKVAWKIVAIAVLAFFAAGFLASMVAKADMPGHLKGQYRDNIGRLVCIYSDPYSGGERHIVMPRSRGVCPVTIRIPF